ncbi:PAS domain S-box protein [Leptolyngbya sp. O-77]|uniref:PAS domain S-box protein n=1 Tax=Leptolyngbya sp. O-77 TaxID=1080068 RepID=UPI00074D2D73|nr:PAS domain S-box protein [Leptolyngbya sp. O-77]BAU40985.1 Methyl-accepting chemotaxis protein PctC [Leptolyngbya sp. O-77]
MPANFPLVPAKFRLRTALVVPFVLEIAAAVGLVGYLSFLAAQRAVNDLASQLRTGLSSQIEQELRGYFATPHDINRLNGAAFIQGNLDFQNPQNIAQMHQQVRISPYIFGSYCGTAQGEFLGAGRSAVGSDEIQFWLTNAATKGRFFYYEMDSRGDRLSFVKEDGEYDPRSRPWYKDAINKRGAVWSDIYLDFATFLPVLTASLPVYSEAGTTLGVCATDVQLPVEFRQFLSSLKIGKTGQAFVIDREGQILSSSTQEPLTVGEGNETLLLQAVESSEPLIQETAKFLQRRFGGFQKIQEPQQLDFSVDGQRQFVQVLPFQDGRGLDWLIVIAVPEADFMSDIYTTTRNAIWLALGALGLAIALGILTARWVTRPIQRISQASNEIAQGALSQHITPSALLELDQLATSFNSMAGQLKSSFTKLEQKNEELRITEENYRSIFENALEGIFQSSPTGQFLKVNPAMAAIYGYDSPEEMVNSVTNIPEQTYVDIRDSQRFYQFMKAHGQVKGLEYQVYRKDGSIIWIEEDARAVYDSQGRLLYYEGLIQDITERRQREDALKKQLEELQIEIDQNKRMQEVNLITQSGYFQELQEELSQVDIDEFWK